MVAQFTQLYKSEQPKKVSVLMLQGLTSTFRSRGGKQHTKHELARIASVASHFLGRVYLAAVRGG